jgi:hypothetical protein
MTFHSTIGGEAHPPQYENDVVWWDIIIWARGILLLEVSNMKEGTITGTTHRADGLSDFASLRPKTWVSRKRAVVA